jgi:hypothetical protein
MAELLIPLEDGSYATIKVEIKGSGVVVNTWEQGPDAPEIGE